jgi:hypothetical protein
MMKTLFLFVVMAGVSLAQSSTVLFEDVKLYYQKPGETKWRDDRAMLALDGGQRVMMLLKDNKPLFVMRYDNIGSMSFDQKRDKTLTLKYGGDSGPAGSVRMELPGKWKDILEAIRSQSQKPVDMAAGK